MRKTAIAVCLMAAATIAVAAAPAEKAAPVRKAASTKKAPSAPAMEKLTCRTGPNDEQARLIAQVVKGRPMEFAYYSRLGTKVCSIHARRGDAYTKWADGGSVFNVKLLGGSAALEYKPGYLRIKFDDVDRMTYCGEHGELNGSIEVVKNKAECMISGVFDLGSAAIKEEPRKEEPKAGEPSKEQLEPEATRPEAPLQPDPKSAEPQRDGPQPQALPPDTPRPEAAVQGAPETTKQESKP